MFIPANYCVGVFALVGISVLEAMLICFLMDLDDYLNKKVEKSVNTQVEIQLETSCHKGRFSACERYSLFSVCNSEGVILFINLYPFLTQSLLELREEAR